MHSNKASRSSRRVRADGEVIAHVPPHQAFLRLALVQGSGRPVADAQLARAHRRHDRQRDPRPGGGGTS